MIVIRLRSKLLFSALRRLLLLFGPFIIFFLPFNPALATKRVVVLPFKGFKRIAVRGIVVQTIKKDHVSISWAQAQAEAKQMGINARCNKDTMPGLARAVGADAIVCGKIYRQKKRRILQLDVHSGGTGKIVKRIRLRFRPLDLKSQSLHGLSQKLNPALAQSWGWNSPEVRTSSVDEKASMGNQAQIPSLSQRFPSSGPKPEAPAIATTNQIDDDDDENPLATPEEKQKNGHEKEDVHLKNERSPQRSYGKHALRLNAGPALLFTRHLSIKNMPPGPSSQGWKTQPLAGLAVEGEIFPAAWATDGWLSHFGLNLGYSRFFGLSWKLSDEAQEHETTLQTFTARALSRWGVPIGKRNLSFIGQFGFHYLDFSLNDTSTERAVIPDVTFSSLDLGVKLEFSFVPDWLWAEGYLGYLPVLGRGEITSFDEFGPGSGNGLRFGGGFQGTLWRSFGWKLSIDYVRYIIQFKVDPRARRANEVALTAHDEYLNGMVLFTYLN
jgi:hypothetical protein